MSTRYPLPFYDDPWVGEQAEAASAIWDWHVELRKKAEESSFLEPSDFDLEARRVKMNQSTGLLEEPLQERIRNVVEKWKLDPRLLALQVEASSHFARPTQFEDNSALQVFADRWAAPVGRLLIALAGANREWQIPWVDAMSRGFFLLGCILRLPEDARVHRVFLPQEEMNFFDVTEQDLVAGPPGEGVRKLLWKQCVRIRDQFAQSLPLSQELPRRQALAFKKWWLGGLEMVNAVERRDYDVWREPVQLSRFHRAQVHYQARFGRLAFKRR